MSPAPDERLGLERVVEVVVARAVEGGVRERRRLGAGLAGGRRARTPLASRVLAVAQIGHRSGDGFVASCCSVIAATTSRRRRSYSGHMRYAARIVRSLMRPPYPALVAPGVGDRNGHGQTPPGSSTPNPARSSTPTNKRPRCPLHHAIHRDHEGVRLLRGRRRGPHERRARRPATRLPPRHRPLRCRRRARPPRHRG